MGMIADSFQATLDAIKQANEESQLKTQQTLERINKLINTLERLDSED